MPDITAELYSIKTKSLGDNVLGAIYDALLKIDNYIGPVELDEEVERTVTLLNLTDTLGWLADQESYNITEELEVIKNSRYGSEIRMAIHDAIDKLNKAASARPAPPEPSKVGAIIGEVGWITEGASGGVFGNAVSEYAPPNLPYIISTINSYGSTNFTPSSTNVKYEVEYSDFEPPTGNTWGQIFGGYLNNMRAGGLTAGGIYYNRLLVCSIGNGERLTNGVFPNFGYHKVVIEISGYNVTATVDDKYVYTDTWAGSLAAPCYIGGGDVKIFGLKIWEGGTLKRDFSPATGAARAGFYDAVSDSMYYSTTSTDFVYVPADAH